MTTGTLTFRPVMRVKSMRELGDALAGESVITRALNFRVSGRCVLWIKGQDGSWGSTRHFGKTRSSRVEVRGAEHVYHDMKVVRGSLRVKDGTGPDNRTNFHDDIKYRALYWFDPYMFDMTRTAAMSDRQLRKAAIKLAYDNPGPIRDALLPVLKQGARRGDIQGALRGFASAAAAAENEGDLYGLVFEGNTLLHAMADVFEINAVAGFESQLLRAAAALRQAANRLQ